MNLKIISKTENEAVIEFVGEGHTILNLLRTELLKDKRVLMATYDTKFPVMDNPVSVSYTHLTLPTIYAV